jgi:antirestriction protein ArdC
MSTSNKAYELVTNTIIEGLKKGRVAWRRPWSVLRPFNPASGTIYKGVNTLLLSMFAYNDPRWMTFKQIEEAGGKIRKGEKGTPIVFWKYVKYEDKDTGDAKSFPLLKHFYVWNVEQVDGLKLPPLERVQNHEPIAACEDLVRLMPNAPQIRHGGGRACYAPKMDIVTMPPFEIFESAEAYYSTLFHELGHATGHESRLNRPEVMGSDGFGGELYSREELVAELCAAFLCQAVGIDNDTENTQAYINGWLEKLQDDPKMIVWAAGRAAAAADYIQGKKDAQEAEEVEESRELVTA